MVGNLGADYKEEELRLAEVAAQKQAASNWLNNTRIDGKGGDSTGRQYKLTETFDTISSTLSNVRDYLVRPIALAGQMIDDVAGHDREESLRRDAEAEEKLRSRDDLLGWSYRMRNPEGPDATTRTVQQLADASGYDPRAINTAITAGMMILPGAGRSAVRRAARYADDFTALAGGTGMGTGAGGNLTSFARPPRTKGIGRIGSGSSRRAEAMVAGGTNPLTIGDRRLRYEATTTNYGLSNQQMLQRRFLASRDVKAQTHHVHDVAWYSKATSRPDGARIRLGLNKNMVRTGNDSFHMVDAWGTEPKLGIFGKDHKYYLHERIYPHIPARKEIEALMEQGSWNRISTNGAIHLLTKAAKETEKLVLKWGNWKIQQIQKIAIDKKTGRPLQGKKLRAWMEENPDKAAAAGSDVLPSYETLNSMRTVQLNDNLRHALGFRIGQSTRGGKSPVIPLEHRRRPSGKVATY